MPIATAQSLISQEVENHGNQEDRDRLDAGLLARLSGLGDVRTRHRAIAEFAMGQSGWLSVAMAATYLGTSFDGVMHAIRRGHLIAYKMGEGAELRVKLADLITYRDAHARPRRS